MGVRPLFFTQSSCGLTFASEIKALLTLPGVSAALDPVALDQVFTFWFPLAPRTLFKGVSELPPAHVLVARGGRVDVRRYWSIEYPETHDGRAGQSPIGRKLDEELSELFLDATRIRLRADVPVGAYLSGGLDSSLTAAAVRHLGIGDLKTFSIAFEDPEFDESAFQQNMVTALGTDHSGVLCQADDIAAALPSVVRHAEAPVLRTSPAPMLLLARHVRQQNFKVVLTGEGADEVFGGYDIFKEAKVRRFCASQPQSRLRPQLLRRLYPYLRSLQRQPQHFLEAFFATGDPTDPLYSHIPRFRTTSGAKALFSPSLRSKLAGYDALDDLRQQLPERFGRWHPLAQAQYLETRYLLPSYLLSSQGDRMTMASAVEGRYPFLDHRLVELGAAIPANLKIRGLQEKYILRRSLGPLLPPEIAGRTKQPYRAPESNAFIGSTAPHYVGRHLSHRAIDEGGCFDPAAVTRLVKKVSRNPTLGARDHMAFLGVLTTQIWREEFASSGIGLVQPTGRLGTESEVRTYAAG
jgi:asparagine synthase (glutamine-hydrolysing)